MLLAPCRLLACLYLPLLPGLLYRSIGITKNPCFPLGDSVLGCWLLSLCRWLFPGLLYRSIGKEGFHDFAPATVLHPPPPLLLTCLWILVGLRGRPPMVRWWVMGRMSVRRWIVGLGGLWQSRWVWGGAGLGRCSGVWGRWVVCAGGGGSGGWGLGSVGLCRGCCVTVPVDTVLWWQLVDGCGRRW